MAVAGVYGERLRGVILYGSWARGEATEASDIDVLVVLDGPLAYDDELRHLSRIAAGLTLEHGVYVSAQPISTQDFEERSEPFLMNVRREGVQVA
ncbi:MAG: nucleotidyltransferase domain-containing protein [Dehalococcoidia bacterium]